MAASCPWSGDPELRPGPPPLPPRGNRTPNILGPSSAAFLVALPGSWIGSTATRTQSSSVIWDIGVASCGLISKPYPLFWGSIGSVIVALVFIVLFGRLKEKRKT